MKNSQNAEDDLNAEIGLDSDSSDDLEDFNKLKTKQQQKAAKEAAKSGV